MQNVVLKSLKKTDKKFVVVYQTSYVTNIENYPPDLEYHNHEEADTLIMLQAKNAADMYSNCEIYLLPPSTCVSNCHSLLPQVNFWWICNILDGRFPDLRVIDIEKVCNSLSAKHTETILGWHLFTECDETARFYIKSKIYFNKTFKSPSPEVLKSLDCLGTDTS